MGIARLPVTNTLLEQFFHLPENFTIIEAQLSENVYGITEFIVASNLIPPAPPNTPRRLNDLPELEVTLVSRAVWPEGIDPGASGTRPNYEIELGSLKVKGVFDPANGIETIDLLEKVKEKKEVKGS